MRAYVPACLATFQKILEWEAARSAEPLAAVEQIDAPPQVASSSAPAGGNPELVAGSTAPDRGSARSAPDEAPHRRGAGSSSSLDVQSHPVDAHDDREDGREARKRQMVLAGLPRLHKDCRSHAVHEAETAHQRAVLEDSGSCRQQLADLDKEYCGTCARRTALRAVGALVDSVGSAPRELRGARRAGCWQMYARRL